MSGHENRDRVSKGKGASQFPEILKAIEANIKYEIHYDSPMSICRRKTLG